MSKLTDNLRKAGVLHTGKGDYQTGEYDDRKDIKTQPLASDVSKTQSTKNNVSKTQSTENDNIGDDNNAPSEQSSGGNDQKQPEQKRGGMGRKITFWVAVVCGLFFLLMSLGSWGVFFIMLIIWGGLLYLLKLWAFNRQFGTLLITSVVIGVIILSFFIVPTDDTVDTDTNGKTVKNGSGSTSLAPTTQCEANNLNMKQSDLVALKIVSIENVQEDHTKDVYSLDELDTLQFGHQSELTQPGYYSIDELCQGEKTLSFDDLEAWNFNESVSGSMGGFGGNYTNFTSKQDDGSFSKTVEEPGLYTHYAYVSDDGKKWFIAAKRDFEVK